ncbi:hypothetical protein BDW68DRAFT_183524 [Aspergillus falconensis]
MAQLPPDDLRIAYGKRHVKLQTGKDEYLPWIVDHPAHWILAAGPSDDREHCTKDVPLNAEGFESIAKVGTIPVAQRAAFKEIVETAIPRRCQDYVAHVLLLLARENIISMEVAEYHRRQVDKSVYAQPVDGPDPAVDVDPKDVEPVNAAEVFGKCEEIARKNKLGSLEYDACLQ